MERLLPKLLIGAIVVVVLWMSFCVYFAADARWCYPQIEPGATYWGEVLGVLFGLIGTLVLCITLAMQRADLERVRREVEESLRIARVQSEQMAMQTSAMKHTAVVAQMLEIGQIRLRLQREKTDELSKLPNRITSDEDRTSLRDARSRIESDMGDRISRVDRGFRECSANPLLTVAERESLLAAAGLEPTSR